MAKKRVPPKLRLVDRFLLTIVHKSRVVDGLWIGAASEKELDRIEGALQVIKEHDLHRYRMLPRYIDRVVVGNLFGPWGRYQARMDACEIDKEFIFDPETSLAMIASVIVHETTHARLRLLGFPYDESSREREERVCYRRQLAFLARVPNTVHARELFEWGLKAPADYSHASFVRERRAAERALLEKLRRERGLPAATVRGVIRVLWAVRGARERARSARAWVRRLLRDDAAA